MRNMLIVFKKRFWPHIEEYLIAVKNMQETTPAKMMNVLKFYGVNVKEEREAEEYIKEPLKLMILPKFINGFSNAANAPFIAGPEAQEFAVEIENMV